MKEYKELRKQFGGKVEIIYVSSDHDKDQFGMFFKEMPWMAIAYKERGRKDSLSKHFGVSGIPTLVVLDAETLETLHLDASVPEFSALVKERCDEA